MQMSIKQGDRRRYLLLDCLWNPVGEQLKDDPVRWSLADGHVHERPDGRSHGENGRTMRGIRRG